MMKQTYHKSFGFTLLEMIVSLSVLTIVIIIAMALYQKSQQSIQEMEQISVMQSIAQSIEVALQDQEVIKFSAMNAFNISLQNCLISDIRNEIGEADLGAIEKVSSQTKEEFFSSAPRSCLSTDPRRQTPVLIIRPPKNWKSAEDTPDFAGKYAIAGGSGDHIVRYDVHGRIRDQEYCKEKTTNCPFEARAWFWAFCPRNTEVIRKSVRGNADFAAIAIPAECDRAQSVNFRYQVSHNKKSVLKGKSTRTFSRQLPSIPLDQQFWKDGKEHEKAGPSDHTTFGAISHDVAQMGRYSEYIGACKKNFTLVAIEDHQPICRCLPPYKLYDKNSRNAYCYLEKHYCKADERYMGTRIDGTAICQPVDCSDVREYDIDAGETLNIDCTKDQEGNIRSGWLWKIEVEGSRGHCKCKKSRNEKDPNSDTLIFECPLKCRIYRTCCFEQ